ncbi:MAG: squalene synthase HpnC [Pseudorhodoplanes sp.]|jgi:squalene synthase HpnC|nr:squalene synthase HpnC [Pseudorhodoplanes sp.]
MSSADIHPSKTHRDENFPVASVLIHPRHRQTILAFYRFARAADDVADHASLPEHEKLARLDRLENTLLGASEDAPEALPLRAALAARGLPPRHAQDLLTAFRMDVTKRRYQDWDDLIRYCSYSAMPVGRFVLDVHGESRATWPASDALCAALQIINHLQDCGADYRNLDRVYIPLDALAREGLQVEALGADKASPGLRRCLRNLAERTSALLRQSELFPMLVNDLRLGLEIAVIQKLARNLIGLLLQRDPLSERVHLGTSGVAALSAAGIAEGISLRLRRRLIGGRDKAQDA